MPSTAHQNSTRAVAAVLLLIVGIGCGTMYRILSSTEQHSFADRTVPSASVHVTDGASYLLSVPDGVRSLANRGLTPASIQCEYTSDRSANHPLDITPESAETKATNAFAGFTAPYTGDISVDCLGWGQVFIDDADNAAPDTAGWYLVLCVIALTIGAALALSALRSSGGGPRDPAARPLNEDEEIERLVQLVHVLSDDGDAPPAPERAAE
ncbi:MAG: hypothetical protein ABI368_01850 [Jatrophihabitantaceae bacterium]